MARRSFLHQGILTLASAGIGSYVHAQSDSRDPSTRAILKIGLITDVHHSDKAPVGSRHYRESLGKLEEAAAAFAQAGVDFVVELGDLIDAADSVAVERKYLATVNERFSAIHKERFYVLGNHCVDTLTKEEFLGEVGQGRSFSSFDRGEWHFVILDACFRSDGVAYGRKNFEWTDTQIPEVQLEWLAADLKAAGDRPVVIFAHQRLDTTDAHGVKNSPKVREILELHGRVRAVFQGHNHANDLREIGGIPYCTLVAMIEGSGLENSGYSILSIYPDQRLELQGFRRQTNRRWTSPS